MTRINVTIALAGEARDRLYEVAALCRARGFGHTSTRSDLGLLVGSAELEDLASLRAVPGVIDVALEEGRSSTRRSTSVRIRSGASLRLHRASRRGF